MSTTLRRSTVQAGLRVRKHRRSTIFPILKIEGKWLERAGFLPHTQVYVHVQDGRIVINCEEMSV